jgi:molecular chaperone HscB
MKKDVVAAGNLSMSRKCWSCSNADVSLICDVCGKVQPPQDVSSFERFGFAPHPRIDATVLRDAYLKKQQMFHPDKYVRKSKEEQAYARQQSEAFNRAFLALKNPINCLEELLGTTAEDSLKNDPLFLMHVMDLQEKMESLSTAEEIDAFKEKINKEKTDFLENSVEYFEKNQMTALFKCFRKLQYLEKTLKDLTAKRMDLL